MSYHGSTKPPAATDHTDVGRDTSEYNSKHKRIYVEAERGIRREESRISGGEKIVSLSFLSVPTDAPGESSVASVAAGGSVKPVG